MRWPGPSSVAPSSRRRPPTTARRRPPEEIVGTSPAMQTVFKRIALVAPREASVLITGESGTGKELVARAIHRHSARRDRPFLPVHVAALNPNLVESELFGHVKGAFTGAAQARPGLLALADGGTVFLDELADIPPQVQVKLLRVLEHNEVLPVGGNQPQPLQIRILAATHQDLARRVAEGHFRHDLFFRLNVFQVHLPPCASASRTFEPGRAFPAAFRAVGLAALARDGALPAIVAVAGERPRAAQFAGACGHRGARRPAAPRASADVRGDALGATPSEQLAAAVRHWLADRLKTAGADAPADLYAELLRGIEPALFDEVMRRVQGNRWVAARWLGLNRATVRKKLGLYGLTNAHRPQHP